jgi:hypothetical protein
VLFSSGSIVPASHTGPTDSPASAGGSFPRSRHFATLPIWMLFTTMADLDTIWLRPRADPARRLGPPCQHDPYTDSPRPATPTSAAITGPHKVLVTSRHTLAGLGRRCGPPGLMTIGSAVTERRPGSWPGSARD